MDKVRLGKTELLVTRIGIGGIQFSKMSKPEAVRIVDYGIGAGINFIETAYGYFDSEEKIGASLRKHKNREIIVATKSMSRERKEITTHLEASLKRLNREYIDLYQFHSVDDINDFKKIIDDGAYEAVIKQREKGKIKSVGFSSHNAKTSEKMIGSCYFDSIQFPISIINEELEDSKLVNKALKKDIGFVVMKPLGGGRLSNAELCLNYSFQFKNAVPVIGVDNVTQLKELIKIAENPRTLTSGDHREIEKIRRTVGKGFCRACNYCQPCPKGIRIYAVLYLGVYYKQMGAKKVFAHNMHGATEKSYECKECGLCEKRCPFGLSIIENMKKSRKLLEKMKKEVGNG